MRPAENIEKLIKNINIETNARTDDVVLDEVVRAFEKSKKLVPSEVEGKETADVQPSIWRIIMKSPINKLATAAIVAIACLIGLSLWKGTESCIALADVLARFDQVRAFRCKGNFTMNGQMAPGKPYKFETRWTDLISQEYGSKLNVETPDPNGGQISYSEFYISPQKKTFIQIAHTEKKYVRRELDDAEGQQTQKELSGYINPGELLKEIMACKYENLGRLTIDGVDVEGFRATDPKLGWGGLGFKDPHVDVKVWVGVKTRLPVQYENLTSGLDEMGNTTSQRFVVHDFQWDVPVDASEFEPPPVPDGYAIVDNPPGLYDEETAIRGLKRCVELFGNYLETISDGAGAMGAILSAFEKSETLAALRLKEEVKGLTEEERLNRVSNAGKPALRLTWFYVELVNDKKDPAYYGKTVTPKDVDKVLLRWKLSDNEYRVIFGDLHAETVTSQRLAELEAALPK
jgi:hypothetical protein